jgi:hypothetical protein
MIHRRSRSVAASIALVTILSCGGSDSPAPPTGPAAPTGSTVFQGTIGGANGQTGTLTTSVQAQVTASSSLLRWPFVAVLHAQTVTATGTVHVAGGSTTNLTGTYAVATRSFNLSGGGFTFAGTIESGMMSGTWNGPGSASGGFSGVNATGQTVTPYCGVGTSPDGPVVINLAVAGSGSIAGLAVTSVPPPCFFTGQVTGSAVTLTSCEAGHDGVGSIGNGTVTVTTRKNGVANGSFTASTGACQ